jgi:hypothetical protein
MRLHRGYTKVQKLEVGSWKIPCENIPDARTTHGWSKTSAAKQAKAGRSLDGKPGLSGEACVGATSTLHGAARKPGASGVLQTRIVSLQPTFC